MKLGELLRRFKQEAAADRIGDVAAMMTYYALFALFPMLVFTVTVALLVLPDAAIDQGVQLVAANAPGQVGTLLTEQVKRMQEAAHGGFAVGGALLALWSASRGSASLSVALNDMFEKEETRPWWKRQLVALGTTLAVAALLLLALGLLFVGPLVGHALADRLGMGGAFDVLWGVVRYLGAGVLVMVVWALLYRWLPNTTAPFRVFTLGAFVGVVLWLAVSKLFGVYVANFGNYEKTYGALGGVIVFLTWLWLSNLMLLIGAELNDVLADLRKGESASARHLAEENSSDAKERSDEKNRRPPSRTPPRRPQPA
jgi:membrane protein